MKKAIAVLVASTLISTAPGLASYETLAADARGVPGIKSVSTPLSGTSVTQTGIPIGSNGVRELKIEIGDVSPNDAIATTDLPAGIVNEAKDIELPVAGHDLETLNAGHAIRESQSQPAPADEKPGVLPGLQVRQGAATKALNSPSLSQEGASNAARRVIEGGGDELAMAVPTVGLDSNEEAVLAHRLVEPTYMSVHPNQPFNPVEYMQGKTLLLVGFRSYLPYHIRHTMELGRRYGFDVLVIDYPDQKAAAVKLGLPPENFIGVDHFGSHDEAKIAKIVEQVREVHKTHPIHAAKTFVNFAAYLESQINQALDLPGNWPATVKAAQEKLRARQIWNEDPDLYLPAKIVRSPAEARAMFEDVHSMGYQRMIYKPESGGGGFLVELGIDSPDAAVERFQTIDTALRKLQADERRAETKSMDRTWVLAEAQIPDIRHLETPNIMLDVETVVQRGRVVYMNVSYNPPNYQGTQERGSTYYSNLFRSHPEIANQIRRNATKAILKLGLEGNIHYETIITVLNGKVIVPPVEANPRMGGKDMWESVVASDAVDLMEQSILAAFNVRMNPRPTSTPKMIQMRFIIPQVSGKIVSIKGTEALQAAGVYGEWERNVGENIEALAGPTKNSSDYVGYFMTDGPAEEERALIHRLLDALKKVEIQIETPDGVIHAQTAAFGQEENPDETLVSRLLSEIDRLTKPTQPTTHDSLGGGALTRIKRSIARFPGSYYLYVLNNGLQYFSDEGLSVVFSIFSIMTFGVAWGLLAQGIYMASKAFGGMIAATWHHNHGLNSKQIFQIATGIKIGMMFALPFLAWFLPHSWFLASFIAMQLLRGLVNGAARNVAEQEMLPQLVGQNRTDLQIGGFFSDFAGELFAMTAAFLYPVMQTTLDSLFGKALGSGILVALLGALTLPNLWVVSKIRYPAVDDAEAPKQVDKKGEGLSKLSWRDYIPYVTARAVHYSFYGTLAAVMANFIFESPTLTGITVGFYDAGALLVSFLGGAAALLASSKADRSFWEKIMSPKGWFGMMSVAVGAYLLASVAHLQILSYAAVAALGTLILITRRLWMASYQSRLKKELHARMSAGIEAIATAVALITVFAPIALAKVFSGNSEVVVPMLWYISYFAVAALGISWTLTPNPRKA